MRTMREGGMTNVCGKQSTYKKDVREGKGGDNKRLWWREV